MKPTFTLLFVLFAFQAIKSQDYPINLDETFKYYTEIKAICDADNGKLWGDNLWAPILLIDKKTRFVVANQPDNEGMLLKTGDVYTGYFPKDKSIANSTSDFGKESWMMVMYPLPEKDYNRNLLCVHELYHRLQEKLNLDYGNYNNDHMDNMDARILIKLEWLALEKAINEKNKKKRVDYLTDALIFRNYRRELYQGKDTDENKIELAEGLAEYTGHKICSGNNEEFKNNVLNTKNQYWNNKSYVRSFGYYSGLCYGYILDQVNFDWKANLKLNSNLGLIAQNLYNIQLPRNLKKSYEKSKNKYTYPEILQFETSREKQRQEMLTAYRFKFTKDTVLIMDIPKPNVVFDPRTLVPLDSLGTVYPTIKIIADWGILQVNEGGCLFDWKKAIVSGKSIKQENNFLIGNGWELELNENWEITRDGMNYKLQELNKNTL